MLQDYRDVEWKNSLKNNLFPLDPEFLKSCFINVWETYLLPSINLKLRSLHLNVALRETFLLTLEIELSTFKTKERRSMCEGYGYYS